MTTANQPFTHSFNHSIIWAPIPSTTRLANHSTNRSISNLINRSINQSINQSIGRSIDQSINQSSNQSINQLFKQYFDINFHPFDTFDVLLHICLLLVCAESSLAMENPGRETYEAARDYESNWSYLRLSLTTGNAGRQTYEAACGYLRLPEATWGYLWQREILAGWPMRLLGIPLRLPRLPKFSICPVWQWKNLGGRLNSIQRKWEPPKA